MIHFLKRNKYKIGILLCLFVLVLGLSGCRINSNTWTEKPYVDGWAGYSEEFHFGNAWEAMWGWPVSILGRSLGFVPISAEVWEILFSGEFYLRLSS